MSNAVNNDWEEVSDSANGKPLKSGVGEVHRSVKIVLGMNTQDVLAGPTLISPDDQTLKVLCSLIAKDSRHARAILVAYNKHEASQQNHISLANDIMNDMIAKIFMQSMRISLPGIQTYIKPSYKYGHELILEGQVDQNALKAIAVGLNKTGEFAQQDQTIRIPIDKAEWNEHYKTLENKLVPVVDKYLTIRFSDDVKEGNITTNTKGFQFNGHRALIESLISDGNPSGQNDQIQADLMRFA